MTYTTTPPSEPGWYWIKPPTGAAFPCELTACLRFRIGINSCSLSGMIRDGYTFGPRIEPPRDDDEELATVEWFYAESSGMNPRRHDDEDGVAVTIDASCGTIWLTNLKIVGVCLSVCDGVEGDDEAHVCPVAVNPTRRKVRQIVEALK